MDTSRIVINVIDQSTSLIENPTAITGFTVVKAPKGPKTPIRVSSGSAAALKDIFGVSSQKYPGLFEVETFNAWYDLWVSAPYKSATVPVAYITKDGIVPGKKNIPYTDDLESVVLGETDPDVDDIPLKGLNDFTALNSIDDPYNIGLYSTGSHPTYDTENQVLKFDLNVSLANFATKSTTPGEGSTSGVDKYKPNIKGITIKGFKKEDTELIIEDGTITSGSVTFKVTQGEKPIGSITAVEGSTSKLTMTLTGFVPSSATEDVSDIIVTKKNILDNFTTVAGCKSLDAYLVKDIPVEEIRGAILPKFPSERDLHIEFNSFNKLKGYDSTSWSSRNILKMDVYEDGAFHDESHKIHIEGSINPVDKDANGAKIGFTLENGTYAIQNLIYVFCLKPFTSDDFGTFTNIEGYAPITLSGGTREFTEFVSAKDDTVIDSNKEYFTKNNGDYQKVTTPSISNIANYYRLSTDLELLNDGWKKSAEGDFTDVDVFFNTSLNLESNWKESRFFSLAKTDRVNHKLAGYYFNKTLSPEEVDVATINNQLSFGRNYWNICNQALISLDNGAKILSPLTGAMSVMICRIIEHRYGGVAPMWENSGTPGMGGQLNSIVDIYKLKHRYTKKQLDTLDDLNYNPVINDRQYGFMVVGQKTCQDGEITDWSYIGHAAAFLNFLKEVRTNVMIPQIGKANNPYYRTLRKEQVERRLAGRLEGNNRIWAYAEVDTSTADGCNDVYARKAKKFVINVKVMVDTFSEKVELNFTNLDQEATVNFS